MTVPPIYARASDSCLMLDYVRVINFCIIIIIIIIVVQFCVMSVIIANHLCGCWKFLKTPWIWFSAKSTGPVYNTYCLYMSYAYIVYRSGADIVQARQLTALLLHWNKALQPRSAPHCVRINARWDSVHVAMWWHGCRGNELSWYRCCGHRRWQVPFVCSNVQRILAAFMPVICTSL